MMSRQARQALNILEDFRQNCIPCKIAGRPESQWVNHPGTRCTVHPVGGCLKCSSQRHDASVCPNRPRFKKDEACWYCSIPFQHGGQQIHPRGLVSPTDCPYGDSIIRTLFTMWREESKRIELANMLELSSREIASAEKAFGKALALYRNGSYFIVRVLLFSNDKGWL